MQILKGQRYEKETIRGLTIEKTKYDGCIFFNTTFEKVIWNESHFHNTSFVGGCSISNCKFIDCKFTGQHTNMGGVSKYINCEFKNVLFKNIQFWTAFFIDCKFSGIAHNIVFYGNEAPEGWETKFDNVDIRQLKLEFVDFRCNFDFSRTVK